MKKYTKFLVVSIVLFLCVIAFSSCNNVDYELTDGTLLYREVEGGYEVTGIADENATEIKIPYFFKLKKVVSIGDGAFYENSNIVSVIIPNSVKEIGYYNFTYCDSLEYIEVPSSVERIRQGCFKYYLKYAFVYFNILQLVTSVKRPFFNYVNRIRDINHSQLRAVAERSYTDSVNALWKLCVQKRVAIFEGAFSN